MSTALSTASMSMPFWNAGGSQRAMTEEPVTRCFQADDLAVRQARGDDVAVDRPIDVVLDVLLARPDHLDRPVDLLGDAHGLIAMSGFEPPAEAAADEVVVHGDLVERQAGSLAASPARGSMTWVPTQTSQESGVTCTVQFIGSMVACARNGSS